MTFEINAFSAFKKPNIDSDEVHDGDLIKKVCKKVDAMSLCISDPLEIALVIEEEFLEKFKLDDVIRFVSYMNNDHG